MSLATNNENWSSYEVTDGAIKIPLLTAFFNRNLAKFIAMTSTKPHGIVTQRIKCQSKTCKDGTRPALFLIFVFCYVFFVLFYVFLCCSMHCLFCVVLCLCCSMHCLFCVVLCIVFMYMCTVLLLPGGYPIAVKYIISYQNVNT